MCVPWRRVGATDPIISARTSGAPMFRPVARLGKSARRFIRTFAPPHNHQSDAGGNKARPLVEWLEDRTVPSMSISGDVTPNPDPIGTAATAAGTVTDYSPLHDHLILFYAWGDGATNTEFAAWDSAERPFSHSHLYAAAGDYTVTITAEVFYQGNPV